MGTAEWFPISSCSSSLHPCPSEGEREVPWPGGGGGGWVGALITDAQWGPMAVAPAAGHLGASMTPTLSKNKKDKERKMGPQLALCSLQGPGAAEENHRWDFFTWIC